MDDNTQQNSAKRRVHVTLVGGQPEPVLNGIMHVKPDVVEFVYTNETQREMERIRKKTEAEVVESLPLSPTNPIEITARAKELCEKYADDEVTINISGGTKLQDIIFSRVFWEHPDSKVLFIDQNNNVYDLKTNEQHRLDREQDLLGRIGLQGTDIASYTRIEDYDRTDNTSLYRIEKMRDRNMKKFNAMFAIDQNKSNLYERVKHEDSGTFLFDDGSAVEWEWLDGDVPHVEIKIFIRFYNGGGYRCTLNSPHAADLLFKSGWYEYKVARALKKWSKARTVLLNCVFKSKDHADKNEVDIILDTGNKIIFVECKTQINQNSDVDKFHSVLRNYGGQASKGVFVTSVDKKAVAQEKCRDHKILDVVFNDDTDLQELFSLLDSELEKINPA